MKFIKALSLLILIIGFSALSATEETKKKNKESQSQFGRNYRKSWPTPGNNPLPRRYFTGPVSNYAGITPKKYREYNRFIANENGYLDTTGATARKAEGKPVFYREDGRIADHPHAEHAPVSPQAHPVAKSAPSTASKPVAHAHNANVHKVSKAVAPAHNSHSHKIKKALKVHKEKKLNKKEEKVAHIDGHKSKVQKVAKKAGAKKVKKAKKEAGKGKGKGKKTKKGGKGGKKQKKAKKSPKAE